MSTLFGNLISNYRDHPAFRFEAAGFFLTPDLVSSFNESYTAFQQFGGALSSVSRDALKEKCLSTLSDIFSELSAECVDDYERLFFSELHLECRRLLREELAWYERRPRAKFAQLTSEQMTRDALSLREIRHFFGCLSGSAVKEILSLGANDLSTFRASVSAGRLKREDLSVNTGPVVRAIRSLLNKEFKTLGVLDAVGVYTGRRAYVGGVALELSVPQATWWRNALDGISGPPKTLYAHLDETITAPKSIVYLTDVQEFNGPTGFYPGAYEALELNPLQQLIGRVIGLVGGREGSTLHRYYDRRYHQTMSSERFRRHFMRLPESLRFNSHLGWDLIPGSEIEGQLAAHECKMVGRAGTFVVFDGARLFHRGGLVEQDHRIALQVVFSNLGNTRRILRKLKRAIL